MRRSLFQLERQLGFALCLGGWRSHGSLQDRMVLWPPQAWLEYDGSE